MISVEVLGGVVCGVYQDGEAIEARIIDWDNLNDEDITCPACGGSQDPGRLLYL